MYSHLSDDEEENSTVASIGAIAERSAVRSRRSARELLPPHSPPSRGKAYQLRRRREAWIERDRTLRTFVVDRLAQGGPPSKSLKREKAPPRVAQFQAVREAREP